MRGSSVPLALLGLGAVQGLPTRTSVEERSPQIFGPPGTIITPGDPSAPPKNCQPEWTKFGICIPLVVGGPITPEIPHLPKLRRQGFTLPPGVDKKTYIAALQDRLKQLEAKKDKTHEEQLEIEAIKAALIFLNGRPTSPGGIIIGRRDGFVIGKPIVGPLVPDKPNPSKPWKWWPWPPPKDGGNRWVIGPPKPGPIVPDKPVPGGPLIPEKPVPGGPLVPETPVPGGEIKPSDKRDTDPVFIIGPPKVGPIIPDKPVKGGPIKPSDKRDKKPIFIIGPPKVGPIVPGRPVTPRPVTPRPVTPRPVTPRPVTPRPVTPRPVTPRPVTPRLVKPARKRDDIIVIGNPTTGPIVPDIPVPGGSIKPSD